MRKSARPPIFFRPRASVTVPATDVPAGMTTFPPTTTSCATRAMIASPAVFSALDTPSSSSTSSRVPEGTVSSFNAFAAHPMPKTRHDARQTAIPRLSMGRTSVVKKWMFHAHTTRCAFQWEIPRCRPRARREAGGRGWLAVRRSRRPGGRQPQPREAAGAVAAVLEGQPAAVSLGDLPAEDQADPGAVRLGGEERHDEVGGRRQAGPAVLDPDLDLRRPASRAAPADGDAAAGLLGGFDRVAHQVDEQLLELVRVRLHRGLRPLADLDRETRLDAGDAAHE